MNARPPYLAPLFHLTGLDYISDPTARSRRKCDWCAPGNRRAIRVKIISPQIGEHPLSVWECCTSCAAEVARSAHRAIGGGRYLHLVNKIQIRYGD